MAETSTPDPNELVPNCVTCRYAFEEYGAGLLLRYKRQAAADPRINVRDLIAQRMREFHEEHGPDDN
jgi:hypothetical protein